MKHTPKILLVGGCDRMTPIFPEAVQVQRVESRRYSGNGSIRSAVARVRSGGIDFVILLCRWLGHPAHDALVNACKTKGVPFVRIRGGASSAVRAVRAYRSRIWRDKLRRD